MSKLRGVYIPSIDAKDLYLAMNMVKDSDTHTSKKRGFKLKTRKGDINFSKYTNVFDASLDLDKVREVSQKAFPKRDGFEFTDHSRPGKTFTNKVINVTFKYSCKSFNKVKRNTYVKFGYALDDLTFHDGIALNSAEVVGILTDTPVKHHTDHEIPSGFAKEITSDGDYIYTSGVIPVLKTVEQLRQTLYKEGFQCEGNCFVRYKRSSGSARVGKCLFIDKRLYPELHKWEMCGINVKDNQPVDLAALESYIALPTSSIIGYLDIDPKSILVIPDYESRFNEESIVVELDGNNNLRTSEKEVEVSNSIFDGQSLIDISIMGNYSDYGMVLLRNRFFKSCCFNTNIQTWFADHNITEIDQLHKDSITLAESIDDIKLITTPSSIKYCKFGKISDWLKQIESVFGVVKHEKKTHYLDGQMVQAHYQLLNTVRMSRDEVADFLKPSKDYLKALRTNVDVFKMYTKSENPMMPDNPNALRTSTDFVYCLLGLSPKFSETQMFYDFRKDTCKSYLVNMKKGHILISGNYSTLFGNPVEMLKQSIGKFDGTTTLAPGTIHTTRYADNSNLLGCRSPHISTSNLLVTKNGRLKEIERYFNLTDEIVCINSINENILERLSGADFDSDQILLSDNQHLIRAALRHYNIFKVPANHVKAQKVKRFYNPESQSDLDFKTSGNKIGEIVNLSQELNSLMWHKVWELINTYGSAQLSNEDIYHYIKPIYHDICQLNVMSCIEIDKAKKEFAVNMASELKKIKRRHLQKDFKGREIKPNFLGFIAKQKNFYNTTKKKYETFDTTMDYLIEELSTRQMNGRGSKNGIKFSSCFEFDDYDCRKINYKQIGDMIDKCRKSRQRIRYIYNNSLLGYDSDEKHLLAKQEEELFSKQFKNIKLNKHTFLKLLSYLDEPDCADIQRYLSRLIFSNYLDLFVELLEPLRENRTKLVQDDNGDIRLYDISYRKEYIIDK